MQIFFCYVWLALSINYLEINQYRKIQHSIQVTVTTIQQQQQQQQQQMGAKIHERTSN